MRLAYILLASFFLYSCAGNEKKEPVTDTDVATAFIRSTLDNDLKTAEKFILPDDTNHQYFETFKRQYQQKDKAVLDKYKTAEGVIDELKRVGCDTARSVLDLTAEELERRTDLEKVTIEDVRRILQEEFGKD
mgnify:CR=1 FL=1